MKKEEFYTAQDVANKLKVNVMTVYRYIKAGKLEAYKRGKEFRISEKELSNFFRKAKV